MAVFGVDALFGVIADDPDFFAFNYCFFDFGRDLYSFDFGRTNGGFIAIDDKKGGQLELFSAFREEVHP